MSDQTLGFVNDSEPSFTNNLLKMIFLVDSHIFDLENDLLTYHDWFKERKICELISSSKVLFLLLDSLELTANFCLLSDHFINIPIPHQTHHYSYENKYLLD